MKSAIQLKLFTDLINELGEEFNTGDPIEIAIARAALHGEYEITIDYEFVTLQIQTKLLELGYKISYDNHQYTISWNE